MPSPAGRRPRLALAALLVLAGAVHFIAPRPYARIVPKALPQSWALPIVWASGVVEILCALALLPRRTRAQAATTAAALFVIVFSANVQMALDARPVLQWPHLIAWLRLPLQVPLVWWAVRVRRRAIREASSSHRLGRLG